MEPDSRGVRLAESELERWRRIPTAVISDELACQGVMARRLRPVTPGRAFAGQAVTVRTSRTANGAPQQVLEAVVGGSVVVVDGSAHPDTAVWGGNLIAGAQQRGGVAIVVDGNVRDTADLTGSTLAVHASGVTPAGLVWGGEVNVAIQCGGVTVRPGALLVGDDDGVIVVPLQDREALLDRCHARLALELTVQQSPSRGARGGQTDGK